MSPPSCHSRNIYVCCSRLLLFVLCLECLARLFLFALCLEYLARLFLFVLCLECLARLFLFALCLECLALPANGLHQLRGCVPLKHNERVWSRWFQVLFASGQGLLNRHLWKHSTSLIFFVLCAFYLPTKSGGRLKVSLQRFKAWSKLWYNFVH